ncbi:MAG: hypothetical protein HY270_00115 [Deltaproteobacteria bacterium]|nr:hypothetical protein [Deltaproteobacteria bacterium]
MNKNVLAVVGLIVVGAVAYVGYRYASLQSEAAKWSGPMKEVQEEQITRDGEVTHSRFVSIIDAPITKVQAVVWHVEDLSKIVSNFKISKLIEENGNTKRVEVGIQALTLPLLSYEMEFTNHPEEHRVTFKTLKSQAQDIEGEYKLEPSPDGVKTRITYLTTAKDKIAVPFPQSVLDSAGRETFVNTVRGIEKAVKQG